MPNDAQKHLAIAEGWKAAQVKADMEEGLKLVTEEGVNGATEEKSWVEYVQVSVHDNEIRVVLSIPILDYDLYVRANGRAAPKHLMSCKQYQDWVELQNQ